MISYKDSGVDIEAGNKFVDDIKPFVKKTHNEFVLGGIGSFSGAFRLPTGYKKPVLLGATDGVGTKLRLAIDAKKYDTIGIDLVAMCVNDLICNFAKPLFFLDYYASSKLKREVAVRVVEGIAKGCEISHSALIGGETAEMPGIYQKNDFDLAGFAVGMAEEDEIDRTKFVKDGDLVLALPSSGIHSNGYSLVRKLFFEELNMKFDDKVGDKNLIDILLEPTRIYVSEFLKFKNDINALAHITGGGIVENLPRVLPENLKACINLEKIKTPEIFKFISKYVSKNEMLRTFNIGVGMIIIASKENAKNIVSNSDAYEIGVIKSGDKKVEFI
ncbi:phosphoribosylformylglycinamidine cyclo-ligase [Campylobacter ureolyticus]|uniref:Phosphoribosylformylglycinamidine cyclo-ligase n=1 Tax=Campylobacter ureolyticus TaxID=827 RepID=A0A9Q4KKL7_9BACT|nr:phosphoribosylformylglycinamidine cyclo-ligase [Campylobacter ureolyticus]MCZ6117237.1 phosphoribosylformylglycinamidine cyclo-ligase [Campylobacter ureolyticus]MCZ6133390.1 phosphoribosylformylglycinamidine cyclo-ligase [Campylobacter ureolyticus]MCZ6135150.1 phosphoribosylformylglycinamidine cyclo-ligase [Campylobacter ureolyticus]MCZ6155371.1 phosphoribosylformylglycinamidine cyclo-ligase [Campylobacter ureolyticus]MCZ6159690.1 phosphoribosylformylglycinamidine cyclo-ligase [Campylobacte